MRRALAFAPPAALLMALAVVQLPLFAVYPGPARDVFPLIRVDGTETTAPNGQLFLTTVSFRHVDVLSALRGWLDPATEILPEEALIPEGQTQEEYDRVTRSQMDESKIAAAVSVLELLTDYPRDHGEGALVQDVSPGSPAEGHLFPGDLIVSVDDRRAEDVESVGTAIDRTEGRRKVTLVVEAGGEERTVALRPAVVEGDPQLGVVLVENFPFEIVIESGEIGGPSAGLMWALGLYDILSEEDLAAGRRIAGTGAIGLDGTVLPIGGVEEKVRGAEKGEAALFLVPRENLAAARTVETDLQIVAVEDLSQALRVLTRTANQAK
jgi:PDZ domain-containing protein